MDDCGQKVLRQIALVSRQDAVPAADQPTMMMA